MVYMQDLIMKGKFSYDAISDVLFVRLPGDYRGTVEQRDFNIDLDTKGNILAVEILDASKILGISPEVLEHHERWECKVIAKEKTISIEFTFAISADAKVHAKVSDRAKREYSETQIAVTA